MKNYKVTGRQKHQWKNRRFGQLSVPRTALHDTFCKPVVNTEMIRATSFGNEVLLHDVAISNDYKKATTQKS